MALTKRPIAVETCTMGFCNVPKGNVHSMCELLLGANSFPFFYEALAPKKNVDVILDLLN